MVPLVLALILQHGIVSARAGLITLQHGGTTVENVSHVPVGKPTRTYKFAKLEAMLNPGSYLRVDQNSEFVLESAELDHISIRLISGQAVIETFNIEKKNPITVHSGAHELRIVRPGVYSISDGLAIVRDGRLEADPHLAAEKGWQLTWNDQGVRRSKTESRDLSPIERWSRQRSLELHPPAKRGGTARPRKIFNKF